ncbi:hypothetical protein SBOR_7347 [Sclerotinia borealis F-4128]|uniref:F-box domain-containing protein n=1 Tax=Sclerotinia borealis (strain F-4128) TaxID=1432307 RepID=W9C8X4_SCLBF|nr:hypothetical protein SBOR_7347 [Sclerotinia borealis F-4128]
MPPAYDEEEGMGPSEKGRHRYQKKNYQGAVVAFTEAMRISTDHLLLTALDHRAATFEKLGQLQSALKDAKEMLELKPELSKGYLRCGKVLQLKGEHELALKIYERGLGKVKVGTNTDKDRVTLQSMFNKLQKSQAPRKTRDPLSYLPLELAEMIAKHLSVRERMICLSVSKSWKSVLESFHKLWTTLDTSTTRKLISQRALRAYLRRSNYTVDEATIRNNTIDPARLQYLTRTCTKLHRLTICGNNPIGETLTSALPLAKSLQYLKTAWTSQIYFRSALESLRLVQATIVAAEFGSVRCHPSNSLCIWPKLETLRVLRLEKEGADISLNNLFESIPNIQTLALNGFNLQGTVPLDLRQLQGLEDLELVVCYLRSLPLFPSTLKRLSLRQNMRLSNQEDDTILLPLLETFNCENTGLSDGMIVAIIKNAPNLKHLHIGSRLVGDYAAAHHDFPLCENLEELGVSCLQYDETRFIRIVDKCPNLKTLDISCTKITGVAVKHFVDQGITWIDLQKCEKVSYDAVEYARGKGVEAIFGFFGSVATPRFKNRINGL